MKAPRRDDPETAAYGPTQPDASGSFVRPCDSEIPEWLARLDLESQDLKFETRYTPIERLGSGGSSDVQLMRDSRIGREVAAKVLRVDKRVSDRASARLVLEACRQAQLEHPAIVPVHDIGLTSEGRLYFTMKRVRGLTLAEILRGIRAGNAEMCAKYSRTKLLSGFNSICLAVAFAHERGVLHRDIKPENIMFGDFGETYLLDWGISKTNDVPTMSSDRVTPPEDVPMPTTIGLAGTPGYMAPEQIRPTPGGPTEAVDIYALGATLFEILTLEPLHPKTAVGDVLSATLLGANARASERAPTRNVPPELEAVCVRATATAPEDRFANARELSQALERYLEGDRDVALREALSKTHAEAAEAAIQAARHSPAEEPHHRSRAMQAIGRALALDPQNARAIQSLVRILSEPLARVPEEVRSVLHAHQMVRVCASQKRAGLVALPMALASVGLCAVSGLQDGTLLFGLVGALAIYSGVWLSISRWRTQPRWVPSVHALTSVLVCCLSARLVNPMFPTPLLLLLNGVLFACVVGPGSSGARWVSAGGGFVGLAAMTLLDVSGALSSSIHFSAGELCFAPLGVSYGPHSLVAMVLLSGGAFVLAAGMLGRICGMTSATEALLLVRNWQLWQLLPRVEESDPQLSALTDAGALPDGL